VNVISGKTGTERNFLIKRELCTYQTRIAIVRQTPRTRWLEIAPWLRWLLLPTIRLWLCCGAPSAFGSAAGMMQRRNEQLPTHRRSHSTPIHRITVRAPAFHHRHHRHQSSRSCQTELLFACGTFVAQQFPRTSFAKTVKLPNPVRATTHKLATPR
jgi:hypothetical protein